jgi:hypothetical protein
MWFGQTIEAKPVDVSALSPAEAAAVLSRKPNNPVEFEDISVVTNIGDVEFLPISFDSQEFNRLYQLNHHDSEVSIAEIVNCVFIIRKYLANFVRDRRVDIPKTIQRLF